MHYHCQVVTIRRRGDEVTLALYVWLSLPLSLPLVEGLSLVEGLCLAISLGDGFDFPQHHLHTSQPHCMWRSTP